MGIPRAILCTPRFSDEVNALSFMSSQNATRNELHPPEDHIEIVYNVGAKGSLLTLCFNQLLVEALNKRDEGEVDYIVMAHADIAASPGWLNVLFSRLRQRGDVVVSAVVPIKEPQKSKTSCAVGSRRDHYDIRRYITTEDRLSTPETFATKDVARDDDEVLLINTGMWIGDLSWPGWDAFAFDFENKIMVNPASGKRQAFCLPEDWAMSFALDEATAPYSASWAVQTYHFGPSVWDSHEIPAAVGAQ
ncbi:MAG: hypothetical protein P4L67_05165 [Candidatus Pacebacteria bacterium]|nr:hypothetical protein [Candidatus Paceibacterota bacterium]